MLDIARIGLATALLLAACGCGEDPLTPEARVRWTVDEMATAAELGDVSLLREFVSDSYQDALGQDKQALSAMVTFHVMRHQNRHVLTRVRDVMIRDDGRAHVVLIAGTAGTAGATPRGDVYHIDLDFVNEGGDWRLQWAQWRPTSPADLL